MNGQLAALATLAAWGGRWLRAGGPAAPPDLFGGNSSFKYVASFTASSPRSRWRRERPMAATLDGWLIDLAERGVTDLALVTDAGLTGPLPSKFASGISRSGTHVLLAPDRSGSTLWRLHWQIGDVNLTRRWNLSALSLRSDHIAPPLMTVGDAREMLRSALTDIRAFTEGYSELASWLPWFSNALSLLDDEAPAPPYHDDMLPTDSALARRQLAAAAIQAWVFGGMGSWNDEGPLDQAARPEHERVSINLHAALMTAIPTAANGA